MSLKPLNKNAIRSGRRNSVSASGIRRIAKYAAGWRWTAPKPAISIRQIAGPLPRDGGPS